MIRTRGNRTLYLTDPMAKSMTCNNIYRESFIQPQMELTSVDCLFWLEEIEHLKAKVDAGADYICTQLFFNNNEFYDFYERCELAGTRFPARLIKACIVLKMRSISQK
jgi:hypothetical protein